jgi:hypothetical protein
MAEVSINDVIHFGYSRQVDINNKIYLLNIYRPALRRVMVSKAIFKALNEKLFHPTYEIMQAGPLWR